MATRFQPLEGASSPSFADIAHLLSAIPSLPRPLLSRLAARMIDRLDEMDGDTDIEPNGDELDDSLCAEDSFAEHASLNGNWAGPGCPLADPPEQDSEDACEAGDDGCGFVLMGHLRSGWGSGWEEDYV